MTLRPKAAISDDLALGIKSTHLLLSGAHLASILDRCLPCTFWVTTGAETFAIVAAFAEGRLLLRQFVPPRLLITNTQSAAQI